VTTTAFRAILGEAGSALREVLANRGLRRIELAWTLGHAADGALLVALLLVAFAAGGPFAVGLVGVIRTAPAILAGPLVGIPAARSAPGPLLFTVHLVRGLAALGAAAVLIGGGPLGLILVLAGVSATAGALVRPIQIAAMPSFATQPGELVAANIAMSTGEGIGTFVGPLLGGAAVVAAGPFGAAVVGSILFVAAFVALLGLRATADELAEHAAELEARSRATAGSSAWAAFRGSLGEAPAALRRAPAAATILAGFGGQVFVRGLMSALIVVASIELLGLGEAGVGLLAAAYGLGGFAGAIGAVGLAGRRRLGPVFAVALSLWGLPLAVVGAVPIPIVGFAALFVSGAANGILDVAGFTLLQRAVPTRARAPVFGLLEAIVGIGVSAGGLVVPILIGGLGSRGALAVAGSVLPILAVATWARVRRADDEAVLPELELSLLRLVPLFARMPMSALERVADALVPAAYAPGDVMMREGDPGDGYLIIASGAADVTVGDRLINRCGPGDGIGEIALVNAIPRTATVTAVERTTAFGLSSADFHAAISGPTSAAAAAAVAAERLARSAG
jgi:hypothetical protein